MRHAAQVPLGRPFVYEPERVGSEPVAPHEVQAPIGPTKIRRFFVFFQIFYDIIWVFWGFNYSKMAN